MVVKGDKADPLKVLERVEKKRNRKVELISPIPKPPTPPPEQPKQPAEEKDVPKTEEKIVSGFFAHEVEEIACMHVCKDSGRGRIAIELGFGSLEIRVQVGFVLE